MKPIFLLAILLVGTFEIGKPVGQKTNGKAENGEEQALIIFIRLSDNNSGTSHEREKGFTLEEEVKHLIEKSGAGEYDGNEIGGGFFTLYIYGPSAARLWQVASPVLERYHPSAGSYCIKRYGKPGAKQDRINLSN